MGRSILREKINARVVELREAERNTAAQLHAIRVAIAELEALLAPDEPTITTDEDITP